MKFCGRCSCDFLGLDLLSTLFSLTWPDYSLGSFSMLHISVPSMLEYSMSFWIWVFKNISENSWSLPWWSHRLFNSEEGLQAGLHSWAVPYTGFCDVQNHCSGPWFYPATGCAQQMGMAAGLVPCQSRHIGGTPGYGSLWLVTWSGRTGIYVQQLGVVENFLFWKGKL